MPRRFPHIALAIGLLSAGCTPTADLGEAYDALYQADAAYTAAMNSGEAEAIVALYADDAVRYPPDGDPSGGVEAIRAWAEAVAGTDGFGVTAWPIAMEMSSDASMGFTLNHMEVTYPSDDGAPIIQWMRDAHRWQRDGEGAWRIVEDIWQIMDVPPTVASLLDGPGVTVTSLGFVDLLGEPVRFSWEASGDLPPARPAGALVPVEIFTVRWDGGTSGSSTRLVMASADTQSPTFLLDEMIQVAEPDGWGYMPISDLEFQTGEAGEPLVLVVSHGGSPGDDGVMPGAPTLDRWVLVDGEYVREEG